MQTPIILHISDTHRTVDEPVSTSEILSYLEHDIGEYKKENIPLPNLVVVSGDLVQCAEPGEYKEALELLRGLAKRLDINPEEIVLVPGNHDVHWPTSTRNLRVKAPSDNFVASFFNEGLGELGFANEEAFQERLQNFRDFYKELKGKDYPAARTKALTVDRFPEMQIEIFGFSSVDQVHQFYRRGAINPEPILTATHEAKVRAIAVWHHDLNWISGIYTDYLDVTSLSLLSTGPFLMGLCGHTHRPANNYSVRISGIDLPVVSAGSLCAGPRERPESVPRAYNIIELNETAARVWVRIKKEKDRRWESCWEFGPATHRQPCYDIPFEISATDSRQISRAPSITRTRQITNMRRKPGTGKSPNPFSESNAKSVQPSRVGKQYVPTASSSQVQHDLPQILLGSRGTGKTALLYTLTLEGQRLSPHQSASFAYVGLYCPMKTGDVSAFNGKGWMLESQREQLFSAFLATLWSVEMVRSLEILSTDGTNYVDVLSKLWGLPANIHSPTDLRQTLVALRNQVLNCLQSLNKSELRRELKNLSNVSLFTGGMGVLDSVAAELGSIDTQLDKVRWLILFDEVEFLNHWQQRCVYRHISFSTQYGSCKIATLPYAHLRALEAQKDILVEGQDYAEVPVVMVDDDEFGRVANGLWEARLEEYGIKPIPLAEAWPEKSYEEVIRLLASEVLFNKKDAETSMDDEVTAERLDDILIESLAPDRKQAANDLRGKNKREFSNEYSRKYRIPFRFRLAKRLDDDRKIVIPLHWGWKQMLKACDNNPREFLKLAEQCWLQYWSSGVVRSLTVGEQYDALRNWARRFARQAPALPHKGAVLQNLLDKTIQKLNDKLHGTKYLANEHFSIDIQDCSQDQAEAIAIGIAYGFLVPKTKPEDEKNWPFPVDDVELRLGYPVAINNKLPLRHGETLKIGSLRQLEFPWWQE